MYKRSFDVSPATLVLLLAAWAVLASLVLASLTPLGVLTSGHPSAARERGPHPGNRW